MSPTAISKGRKPVQPQITTEGSYVGGNVSIHNGTFVGRDQNILTNNAAALPAQFLPIYQAIEKHESLQVPAKAEVKEVVKEVETELTQTEEPNERLLIRLFKDLKKMAPDILQVVCTTLSNPTAGLTLTVQKIVDRAILQSNS